MNTRIKHYRVGLVVWQLGWVDLDLGSPPGWRAAIVATYCPSRMVEHPKSKSTQPICQTTSPTLYCSIPFGKSERHIIKLTPTGRMKALDSVVYITLQMNLMNRN